MGDCGLKAGGQGLESRKAAGSDVGICHLRGLWNPRPRPTRPQEEGPRLGGEGSAQCDTSPKGAMTRTHAF